MSSYPQADECVISENMVAPAALAICGDGLQVNLGAWALDFINLGRTFAHFDCNRPWTLAVSLPTLDFSAVFAAAGFVAERAESEARAAAARQNSQDEAFCQLCSLEKDAPVRVNLRGPNGPITVLGRFAGTAEREGQWYAVIEYYRGTNKTSSAKIYICKKKVGSVYFDPSAAVIVDRRDVGKVMPTEAGLAAAFIPRHSAVTQLLHNKNIDCVIVGVLRALTHELQLVDFEATSASGARPIPGTLQDVVRPSNFLSNQQLSRSLLIPIRGEAPVGSVTTPLAIFRGGAAYLHRAVQFPKSHHLVFVSPIEADFDVSVAALNQQFLHRSENLAGDSLHLPAGVSAMGFGRGSVDAR